MLPTTSSKDSAGAEGTSRTAKSRAPALLVYRRANPVGEPDAANPHVRFDERGVETEEWGDTRAPATERAGQHARPHLHPPRHSSTLPRFLGRTSRCSRRGRHYGFSRYEVFAAGPAAELGRSGATRCCTLICDAIERLTSPIIPLVVSARDMLSE